MGQKNNNVVALEQPQPDIAQLAIDRAHAWLNASPNRKQGDIAAGTRYSRATVNRFLKGTYSDGDQTSVARAILDFISREETTGRVVIDVQPVETKAFRRVFTALDVAKFTQRMAVVYGPPGTGKTFAARHYAEQDSRFNFLLMTHFGMGAPKGFLATLFARLKNNKDVRYYAPDRMAGWIIDELRQRPRFIIVNDAHRCRFGIYELACDIIEQANVGFAFVGHEIMRQEIQKLQRRDSEVFDRVADFANFTPVGHDCSDAEIRDVARQHLPDITKDAVKLLADVAVFPSMRSVVNTCLVAKTLILRSKKPLTADANLIKQALKLRRAE